MFEYLKGELKHASPHKAVVDLFGVGYAICISVATFQRLPQIGQEICLYTAHVVREDSERLFGFLTPNERDAFETLNGIGGVGPRLAISILGHMSVEQLHRAIDRQDSKSLTKIPGIGKKMAERLIFELQDKLSKEEMLSTASKSEGVVADAVGALINLGYKAAEAQKAVDQILSDQTAEPPLAEVISLALKLR